MGEGASSEFQKGKKGRGKRAITLTEEGNTIAGGLNGGSPPKRHEERWEAKCRRARVPVVEGKIGSLLPLREGSSL